jgi:hypothetical protein
MQNLDTLLKEILITPLVGAMIERGIKPAPACACGERSGYELDGLYLCRECYEQFWERAR